jgi:hypothetical protein
MIQSRPRLLALLLFLSVFSLFSSCKKIKYGSFKIENITILDFDGTFQQTQPKAYIKCTGPGVDDITNSQDYYGQEMFFSTTFEGSRGAASYDFALIEKLDGDDRELNKASIDFGKYKGQNSFVADAGGLSMRFRVTWDARW